MGCARISSRYRRPCNVKIRQDWQAASPKPVRCTQMREATRRRLAIFHIQSQRKTTLATNGKSQFHSAGMLRNHRESPTTKYHDRKLSTRFNRDIMAMPVISERRRRDDESAGISGSCDSLLRFAVPCLVELTRHNRIGAMASQTKPIDRSHIIDISAPPR